MNTKNKIELNTEIRLLHKNAFGVVGDVNTRFVVCSLSAPYATPDIFVVRNPVTNHEWYLSRNDKDIRWEIYQGEEQEISRGE